MCVIPISNNIFFEIAAPIDPANNPGIISYGILSFFARFNATSALI